MAYFVVVQMSLRWSRRESLSSVSDFLVELEDFKILKHIGSGQFGDVFRSEDLRKTPPEIVALKRCKICNPENVGNTMNEVDILAKLKHPDMT